MFNLKNNVFYKIYFVLIILFLLFNYRSVVAIPCNNIFTDALQTSSSTGTIQFTCRGGNGAVVCNSPDKMLETTSVTPASCTVSTCGTAAAGVCGAGAVAGNCTANASIPRVGTMAATFTATSGGSSPTFASGTNSLATGDYNVVTINGGTVNFTGSGPWRMNQLSIRNGTTVNFAAGDVFIGSSPGTAVNTLVFNGGGNRTITTSSATGSTRIFVNSSVNVNQRVTWNAGVGSTSERFLFYIFGTANSFTFARPDILMKALVYSQGTINISETDTGNGVIGFTGSAVAAGTTIPTIQVGTGGNAKVIYSAPTCSTPADCYGSITCIAPPIVTQYGLSFNPGTNLNYCQTVTMTVAAQDADGTTVPAYARTIIMDTNNGGCTSGGGTNCFGTWSNVAGNLGTFNNFGGSNGYAEYTFVAGDGGDAQFTLSYPANGLAAPVIKVSEQTPPTSIVTPATQTLNYNPSQITVTATTPQVGGRNISPGIQLAATTPSCGANPNYTGSKTLRFWAKNVNPSSGASSTQFLIANTAIVTSPNDPSPGGTNIAITFTSGAATLAVTNTRYDDVGAIELNLKDTATGGPTCGSWCKSSNIIFQPGGFLITGTGIPGTNDPTVTPAFKKAGENFNVTVQAVLNNLTTPAQNYGNETTPEKVRLTATLNAPAGGVLGTLNTGTVTKTGTATFSVTGANYGEVGAINVTADVASPPGFTSSNYLSSGTLISGVNPSFLVGRFQPDHFAVTGNTPQLITGCSSGFTYLDKPFIYNTAPILTVVAQNASNGTTQNYTGTFKKLSTSNFPAAVQVYTQNTSTTSGTPSFTAASLAALSLPTENVPSNGTMQYTFSAGTPGLIIGKPAATSTPYPNFLANVRLSIQVTDSDTPAVLGTPGPFIFNGGGSGIAFNNTANFYQGRLIIFNTSGSNIASLNVPMQTQFYTTSGGYTVNSLDNCSAISNTSHITINSPAPTQGGVATTVTAAPGTFIAGQSNIALSAPTPAGASGQTNLSVLLDSANANMPWLQSLWPYTSSAYGNPRAQVNWGFYPGNPKVIYQEERYP